jgi:ABC-type transport system involved in cytochrome c biogenesis ATPase subunit
MALRDELYTWLHGRPMWQQDLASRLLLQGSLDPKQRDQVMRSVLAAHGWAADSSALPPLRSIALEDLLPTPGPEPAPRLLMLGHLEGVAAVAAGQELRFAQSGLTVIYGQNASGKSSYVRALKRACRAVDKDTPIFANVFLRGRKPAPSAMAIIWADGHELPAQRLDLTKPGPPELATLSVFDARCAELYVVRRTTVEYVPSALALLERLASIQDQLRTDIDARIDRIERSRPKFPEFTELSAALTMVQGLVAGTSLERVEKLATLSDADHHRRAELQAAIAASQLPNVRAEAVAVRSSAQQADLMAARFEELYSRLDDRATERLRSLVEQAQATTAAAAVAAEQFEESTWPGIGTASWHVMWTAARSFVEEQLGATFPPLAHKDQHCPLCLQELSIPAHERLLRFDEYVRSTVRDQQEQAAVALETAVRHLDEDIVTYCVTPVTDEIRAGDAPLGTAVEATLDSATRRLQALRVAISRGPSWELPVLAPCPSDLLKRWAQDRRSHADRLDALGDPETELAVRAELAELDGRMLLATRLADIKAWVENLKLLRSLNAARSALHTRGVTTKKKELAALVVTDALSSKLRVELDALRFRHMVIEVDTYGQVGSTQVQLRLAGTPSTGDLSTILSEGEQRALSLAFFLAEVSVAEHDGTIVLDDPVSSLDHERREYIANRLCLESRRRQVIVFTHDLPFMLDLQDRAKALTVDLAMHALWRAGDAVGRVDSEPPFETLRLRERVGRLKSEVQNWPKEEEFASYDARWNAVCDVYRRMRMSWERAVEERLFKGVVQRFAREVHTLQLRGLVVTDALVKQIEEGMDRCSDYVHDQPPMCQPPLPARAELQADIDKLDTFERSTRS